ncbi:MAG: hypothetical protein HUU55_08025 [Myxococcales bacterium]|nr:hypothetical protein [Myxococcales bacterium]
MTVTSIPRHIAIELLSDTTFSRGEGTAGQVDIEVEHDDYGLPMVGGRTIRGLLRDSWLTMCWAFPELNDAAQRVLGPSQALTDTCILRIGDAHMPSLIRNTFRQAVSRTQTPLHRNTVLGAFTTVRYQTAENRETGAPKDATLHTSRVVIRGFVLEAPLTWLHGAKPTVEDKRVLALCCLAVRHGGLLRNRGRGHIQLTLDGNKTQTHTWAGV